MKYEYIIFCPYFGSLPDNIEIWINSCSYNSKMKFIVFTDDTRKLELPNNVEIINITFDEFKKKVQEKFDFKISLDSAYKLCDYKIAYGYIFEEYLNDCKYWGACDMDLVFGDLEKFFPSNIEDYDKLSIRGHLTLIKNTPVLNRAFMDTKVSKITYRDILSNKIHFGSDEIGEYSINNIFEKNNYKIFNYENYVADINPRKKRLKLVKTIEKNKPGKKIFVYNKGKVICYNLYKNNITEKEYAYIHMQKRKIKINIVPEDYNKFIITYKSLEKYEEINEKMIKKYQPKFNCNVNEQIIRAKSLKKRIIRDRAIKQIKRGK